MKISRLSYLMTFIFCYFFIITCKKEIQKPKPIADFSYSFIQAGILPTDVQFTSNSQNSESYNWDFGDNTTSSDQNPKHTYNAAKTYKVKLVVTNSIGKDSITKDVAVTLDKPKPDFNFTIHNNGYLPDTVDFSNASSNASSVRWFLGDGDTSSKENPQKIYKTADTFNVKLIATNAAGSDSITKQVVITLNKPTASFDFTTNSQETLPVTATFTNNSTGSAVQYQWYFDDTDTSSKKAPTHNFVAGGIYTIKLVVKNAAGSDSAIQQLKISPYPQAYTDIEGAALNLYAWVGNHVMILSRNHDLNRTTMYKWLKAMDTTYGYYRSCTGRDPTPFAPTFIDNHTAIADVPATCGAGCNYIGFTGIEMLNYYFDVMYNAINNNNQYDQVDFYEFGRNFWFYGNQLAYKANDPITAGFAVYMRFTSMNAAGVDGAAFGSWTFDEFKTNEENLVDEYLADTTLNWNNTLGIGQGVPNSGLGATDLFASFCMRLQKDYGGENFVENVWKQAGLTPNAVTTQDAVDNFFLASCAAVNKNLTALFQSWRWPLSASAVTAAKQYQ